MSPFLLSDISNPCKKKKRREREGKEEGRRGGERRELYFSIEDRPASDVWAVYSSSLLGNQDCGEAATFPPSSFRGGPGMIALLEDLEFGGQDREFSPSTKFLVISKIKSQVQWCAL